MFVLFFILWYLYSLQYLSSPSSQSNPQDSYHTAPLKLHYVQGISPAFVSVSRIVVFSSLLGLSFPMLFESNEENVIQCPDCGKKKVRVANTDEIKEFESRVLEEDDE